MDDPEFKTLDKKLLFENKWIKVFEADCISRKKKLKYTMVARSDAVAVIPITKSKKTLLLKHYRFPVNEFSWEFPLGSIDDGEDQEKAALRELKEETGISAKAAKKIAQWYPAPGLSHQSTTLFIAEVSEEDILKARPDGEEEISEVKIVSINDLRKMVDKGIINDGYTLTCILHLFEHLKKL